MAVVSYDTNIPQHDLGTYLGFNIKIHMYIYTYTYIYIYVCIYIYIYPVVTCNEGNGSLRSLHSERLICPKGPSAPLMTYFGLNVPPIWVLCGLSISYTGTWTLWDVDVDIIQASFTDLDHQEPDQAIDSLCKQWGHEIECLVAHIL